MARWSRRTSVTASSPLPPCRPAGIEAVVRDEITGAEHVDPGTVRLGLARGRWAGLVRDIRPPFRARARRPAHRHAGVRRHMTLYADDRPLTSGFREASPMVTGPDTHCTPSSIWTPTRWSSCGWSTPPAWPSAFRACRSATCPARHREPDDDSARAAALAADSDVAVVLAGRISGEAMDVDSLLLPGDRRRWSPQWPRPIPVRSGHPGCHPVILPQPDGLAALLHAWFPGEQFAEALAAVLTGDAEPGGRLPITFPADEQRTPIDDPRSIPGSTASQPTRRIYWSAIAGTTSAGWHPRFRSATGSDTRPSRSTAWRWRPARTDPVPFGLPNTGSRAGKAVPQIYVRHPPDAGEPSASSKVSTRYGSRPASGGR